MNNQMVDHALAYAELGYAVFPCHVPLTKNGYNCSCEAWKRKHNPDYDCASPGKHPRTQNGLDDATTDADLIREWWGKWPTANIGINCGASGLLVVDRDSYKDIYAGDDLELDEETVTGLSGGGGTHLFYRMESGDRFGSSNKNLPDGVDIKGHGGYVVVAPSKHKSGGVYQWELDYSPWDIQPAPIPQKLRELLTTPERGARVTMIVDTSRKFSDGSKATRYGMAAIENQCAAVSSAVNGTRNNTLNTAAFSLGRLTAGGEIDEEYARERLMGAALTIGLTEDEAGQTIASGLKAGAQDPKTAPAPDDSGFGTAPSVSLNGVSNPGDVAMVADLIKVAAEQPTASQQIMALMGIKTLIAKLGKADRRDPLIAAQLSIIFPKNADRERFLDECGDPPADNILLTYGTHDEGNAQCVHKRYNGRFCHNGAFGWMHHTGTHWTSEGAEAAVERAITETLEARMAAGIAAGASQYGQLIKDCIPNNRKVNAAKGQLQSLVYASVDSFDSDPDLLNCKNGVVNLRTGTITPHSPDQRFLYCTPVAFNPMADFTMWTKWLEEATSKEDAEWLQTAVGYSITGHTREEVLFYLFGKSRSGKGTFDSTLREALGSTLAKSVQFSTFTTERGKDDQNFDLAPLKPARFIAASESRQYERFNEAKVKQVTGGDSIQCAFKHKTHFEYKPQFKIWLSSNHPVNADPDDDAVWGRVRVIEFPHSHLGNEDKSLKQRMHSTGNLEAVLAWAIRGAMEWYKLGDKGLPELPSNAAIKQAQRNDLDSVQMWLDECCITTASATTFALEAAEAARVATEAAKQPADVAEKQLLHDKAKAAIKAAEGAAQSAKSIVDAKTASSTLYQSYQQWCKENGVSPKLQKGFTQSLDKKGFTKDRAYINGKQCRVTCGLRIDDTMSAAALGLSS